MNRILPIIPARSGSKGIPNKNLQQIGGISLLSRTVRHSLHLSSRTKPVVSSDTMEYGHHVGCFLGEEATRLAQNYYEFPSFFFHLRGVEDASDHSLIGPTLARLSEELEGLGVRHDACLLLQPTSPFRAQEELTEILPSLLQNTIESDLTAVSLTRIIDSHPARMYSVKEDGVYQSLSSFSEFATSRRQDLQPLYLRDGAYYLASKKTVRTGQHFGDTIFGFERYYPYSINVDSYLDLKIANLAHEAGEAVEDPNETDR